MTNRTPHIAPDQQAQYQKSSFTNEPAGTAPAEAKPARTPAAKKKPAKKPARK
jgi:hypothetical protein